MKVSTVTLKGDQFPFIKAYSGDTVYTTYSTDLHLRDDGVKRRMEEYVSFCRGQEYRFIRDAFRSYV